MKSEVNLNPNRPSAIQALTRPSIRHAIVCLAIAAFATSASAQTQFIWQGDNNNNWQNSANWSQNPGAGDRPNANDDHVRFDESAVRYNVDANNNDWNIGNLQVFNFEEDDPGFRFFRGTVRIHNNLTIYVESPAVVFDTDFAVEQVSNSDWDITGVHDADLIFNGVLSGNGTIDFSGDIRFNNANTYSGNFHATSGTGLIRLGNSNALQNALVTLDKDFGLDADGADFTLGALQSTGDLNIGGGTLTVGSKGSNRTYSGNITGVSFNGGAIVYNGTNVMTMSGSISGLNSMTSEGGELRFSGNSVTLNGDALLSLDGGNIRLVDGAVVTLNAVGPATGSLVNIRSNTLFVAQSRLTTARMLGNSNGTVVLTDPAGGDPALTIGEIGGEGTSFTFAGQLQGSGTMRKVGDGIMTMTGTGSLDGLVDILDGRVALGSANALQDATVNVQSDGSLRLNTDSAINKLMGSGALILASDTLTVSEGGTTFSGPITGNNNSGLTKNGSGALTINNTNTFSGTTTINSGTVRLGVGTALESSTIQINTNDGLDIAGLHSTIGALAGSGNLSIGSRVLTTGGNDNSTTYSGVLSGTNQLIKVGTGALTMSGNNSFNGFIEIDEGSIIIGSAETLKNARVEININNGLNLNGLNTTIGSLAGSGNLSLGSSQLDTNRNNLGTTYSGVLSGSGSLIKSGNGVLTLTGSNTFSGGVSINNGTLRANNSGGSATGTGIVAINNGGTLGGTGSSNGAITVASGGKIAPGASAGTLSVNSVTFDAGSTLRIEIGGLTAGSQHDVLAVTNAASLGGTLDMTYISAFTAAPGESFVILTAGTLTPDIFDTIIYPDGQNWHIEYDTNAGTVTVGICPDDDADGVCDADDICPGFDDNVDDDSDGVPNGCDICLGGNDNVDGDNDGVPDFCDSCPLDNPDDSDADGVCDSSDDCPGADDNLDGDSDGVPDGCDPCPLDNPDDSDADGVCDSSDACPGFDDNVDDDNDGIPNACDTCPNRKTGDVSGDGNLDLNDVASFVSVLTDPDSASVDEFCAADVNEDGNANGRDVQSFVNLILDF